jgi:hypothetical protein
MKNFGVFCFSLTFFMVVVFNSHSQQVEYVGVPRNGLESIIAKQATNVWCWAASCQMILNFYFRQSSGDSFQQQVVNVFISKGGNNNTGANTAGIANVLNGWQIDNGKTLQASVIYDSNFNASMNPNILINELRNGRPCIVGFSFLEGVNAGFNHAVVVYGVDVSNSSVNKIYLIDPKDGKFHETRPSIASITGVVAISFVNSVNALSNNTTRSLPVRFGISNDDVIKILQSSYLVQNIQSNPGINSNYINIIWQGPMFETAPCMGGVTIYKNQVYQIMISNFFESNQYEILKEWVSRAHFYLNRNYGNMQIGSNELPTTAGEVVRQSYKIGNWDNGAVSVSGQFQIIPIGNSIMLFPMFVLEDKRLAERTKVRFDSRGNIIED